MSDNGSRLPYVGFKNQTNDYSPMKDTSLRAALDERRATHPEPYRKLEELINLQHPDRFDQLTNTSLERYQQLRSAGFPSGSLIDQLTTDQLKRLAKVLKLDASRVFLKADIDALIRIYGLSYYATRFYTGKAWAAMEEDLRSFQQIVLEKEYPQWYEHDYSVLGVSPALNGYPVATSRMPLLFFHIGKDIYFLVSTYDSWISGWRRMFYWPFTSYRNGTIAWVAYMAIFILLISWVDKQTVKTWLIPIAFLYLIVYMLVSALPMLRSRNFPNHSPRWLNRLFYRVLPY